MLLIILFWISCCGPAAQAQQSDRLKGMLDSYLNHTVEDLGLAGLTVAITRNDSVIYTAAFGVRNLRTGGPLTPDHFFHWASVSKTVVGTAVMQLAEQGKIDIDAKVTSYLPYFRQRDSFYKDITIRQMLNHTSGIGDVSDYEWDNPQYDSGALERYVKRIANDKMLFKPGADMRYSNNAYEVLGDVISKVSGMSFDTYVKKNILDPLGMEHSTFLYPEVPEAMRVTGHRRENGKPVVSQHYPFNRMHGPSSTLNSTVKEMTRYAFVHLNRGVYNGKRILGDEVYDMWWTNTVNIPEKPSMGLSWWLGMRNDVKTVSHSGGDTGFRSFFLLVPERNISVMLVANDEGIKTQDVAMELLDIVMGVRGKK